MPRSGVVRAPVRLWDFQFPIHPPLPVSRRQFIPVIPQRIRTTTLPWRRSVRECNVVHESDNCIILKRRDIAGVYRPSGGVKGGDNPLRLKLIMEEAFRTRISDPHPLSPPREHPLLLDLSRVSTTRIGGHRSASASPGSPGNRTSRRIGILANECPHEGCRGWQRETLGRRIYLRRVEDAKSVVAA